MISRRDKLLKYPWEQQRYEQHKERVRSAKPAIDTRTPPIYSHVSIKLKKLQKEKERRQQIETENVRLLQKLGDIMTTKRLKNFWVEPRPNFLNREKLFRTRPHTSLPKLISIYAPANESNDALADADLPDWYMRSPLPPMLKLTKSKLARRCPTCSGRPEVSLLEIPESRIPWEPPKKSWNIKVQKLNAEPPKELYCCDCHKDGYDS